MLNNFLKVFLAKETEKIALQTTKVSFFLLMCVFRKRYLKIYQKVCRIQRAWRVYLAKCELRRRKIANLDIERLGKIKIYLRNYKDKARLNESARKI